MTAFAAAIGVIFSDPNMAEVAMYFEGGAGGGVPVRVMRQTPDVETSWSGGSFVSDTVKLDVRVSEVPVLSRGDRFRIGDDLFEVEGDPVRDGDRLIWKAQARAL